MIDLQWFTNRPIRKFVSFLIAGSLTCVFLLLVTNEDKESEIRMQTNENMEYLQVYLMDEEQMLIPLAIAQEEVQDSKSQIEVMLGYLSGEQKMDGFSSFFSKEDIYDTIEVRDACAILDLNENFLSYEPELELQMLESIVWGCTQFPDVKEVVLTLEGKKLTTLPLAQTPLLQPLTRAIGINQFESSNASLHDTASILVYGIKNIDGIHYLVPKSRRVDLQEMASLESQVAAVIEDLSISSSLSSTMQRHALEIRLLEEGLVELTLDQSMYSSDQSIKKDDVNALILSLCALNDVNGIQLQCTHLVQGCEEQKIYTSEELQYNILN